MPVTIWVMVGQASALVNNVLDKTYFSAGRLGINPVAPSTFGAIGPGGFNYNSVSGFPRSLFQQVRHVVFGYHLAMIMIRAKKHCRMLNCQPNLT